LDFFERADDRESNSDTLIRCHEFACTGLSRFLCVNPSESTYFIDDVISVKKSNGFLNALRI
jgi:hypothetical protein